MALTSQLTISATNQIKYNDGAEKAVENINVIMVEAICMGSLANFGRKLLFA
jgi:hypothetical protein